MEKQLNSELVLARAQSKIHQQEAEKLKNGILDALLNIEQQIAKIAQAIEQKGHLDGTSAEIISNIQQLTQESINKDFQRLPQSEIAQEITLAASNLARVFMLTRINEKTEAQVKTNTIKAARSVQATNLVNSRHNQPGGSREKQEKIKAAWLSGQYPTKAACAREQAKTHNLEVESVRNQLKHYSNPDPWPAKDKAQSKKNAQI